MNGATPTPPWNPKSSGKSQGQRPSAVPARYEEPVGLHRSNPLSPEPLAFLLPSHRDEYRFTSVRAAKERDRSALVIAFQTANRKSRVELIEDAHGHDDSSTGKDPVSKSGRVWVDAATADVLKVESWLDGPVDIQVPTGCNGATACRHG